MESFTLPWIVALAVCSVFSMGIAVGAAKELLAVPGRVEAGEISGPLSEPADHPHLDLDEDCYKAHKGGNRLTCDKEGYFISHFGSSVWWDPGHLASWDWVRVPASPAYCCRPKLPNLTPELLPNGTAEDVVPVAIVSVGCHTSTDPGLMKCEADGNSFVTGFSGSDNLAKVPDTYYPVDGIECCTPVVLMSSGDAWSIERCGCYAGSDDISCEGPDTGSLLVGYESTGETGSHKIPLAPAACCKLCLGHKVHSLSDCSDLKHCNGNGICILGSCQCRPGYAGADCSHHYKTHQGQEHWYKSFWWLGLIGFFVAFGGLFVTFWMSHRPTWGEHSRQPYDQHTALMDPEGSAGSVDTYSDRSSLSLALGVVHERGSNEHANPGGEAYPETPRGLDINNRPAREGAPMGSGQRRGMFRDSQAVESMNEADDDVSTSTQVSMHIEEAGPLCSGDMDVGSHSHQGTVEDGEVELALSLVGANVEGKGKATPNTETGTESEGTPLKGISCTICFERPVQIALVPCGHSNICRKCSRKLEQCPFCRKDIVRRQKLFLTG